MTLINVQRLLLFSNQVPIPNLQITFKSSFFLLQTFRKNYCRTDIQISEQV